MDVNPDTDTDAYLSAYVTRIVTKSLPEFLEGFSVEEIFGHRHQLHR
jgi:hypothetical protein